jgi:hypothetical protein
MFQPKLRRAPKHPRLAAPDHFLLIFIPLLLALVASVGMLVIFALGVL